MSQVSIGNMEGFQSDVADLLTLPHAASDDSQSWVVNVIFVLLPRGPWHSSDAIEQDREMSDCWWEPLFQSRSQTTVRASGTLLSLSHIDRTHSDSGTAAIPTSEPLSEVFASPKLTVTFHRREHEQSFVMIMKASLSI